MIIFPMFNVASMNIWKASIYIYRFNGAEKEGRDQSGGRHIFKSYQLILGFRAERSRILVKAWTTKTLGSIK